MPAELRADFAERLEAIRLSRYGGNRKAVYTDVKVNATTWARAENGESLKERSLVAIVGKLWPETGGDWRRIDPPLTVKKKRSRTERGDAEWLQVIRDAMAEAGVDEATRDRVINNLAG